MCIGVLETASPPVLRRAQKSSLCKTIWLVFVCAHARSYVFMTYENVSGSFKTPSSFRNVRTLHELVCVRKLVTRSLPYYLTTNIYKVYSKSHAGTHMLFSRNENGLWNVEIIFQQFFANTTFTESLNDFKEKTVVRSDLSSSQVIEAFFSFPDSNRTHVISRKKHLWPVSHSPFTLANFSFVNLVFIFRCSSSKTNPVCERNVNLLVCSLPLHRHSYISFIFSFRFIDS